MKATRFAARRGAFLSLALLALAAGCSAVYEESFTYKLWNNESFLHFNEPASDPHLLLFADPKRADVLVQYDEIREKDGQMQRRAFFANANRQRLEAGQKPRFVSTNAAAGLAPIPILRADSGQPIPAAGLCVVLDTNQLAFTLHSDGRAATTVALPTYSTTGGARKAFLTPLTVTGDTLVVGVTAGLIAAWAWAQSGVRISTCR
jgi:hypothetical protein